MLISVIKYMRRAIIQLIIIIQPHMAGLIIHPYGDIFGIGTSRYHVYYAWYWLLFLFKYLSHVIDYLLFISVTVTWNFESRTVLDHPISHSRTQPTSLTTFIQTNYTLPNRPIYLFSILIISLLDRLIKLLYTPIVSTSLTSNVLHYASFLHFRVILKNRAETLPVPSVLENAL